MSLLLLALLSSSGLDGHWAKLTRLESLTKVPVLGDISQKTEVLSLLEVKTDANGRVLYREKTCRLTSKTFGGMVRTSYPPAFLRMLQRDWSPVHLGEDGDQVTVVQEKKPRDYGGGGRDEDRDGRPGVTIKVSGLISGEIYATVREWSTSLGRLVDNDTIEGRVEWDAGVKVLGASTKKLRSQPKTRRSEDPKDHSFVMRRVRDTANCKRLVEQVDDVF